MLDPLLIAVNQWMSGGLAVAAVSAFVWGMVSVLFSPCQLASIPRVVDQVDGRQTAVNPRRAAGYAVILMVSGALQQGFNIIMA